jgi:hypothetical protein
VTESEGILNGRKGENLASRRPSVRILEGDSSEVDARRERRNEGNESKTGQDEQLQIVR